METCTCGELHIHARTTKAPINAVLRQDPTRTTSLRIRFEREMIRRFNRVKRAIIEEITTKDIFGLVPRSHLIQSESRLVDNLEPRAFEFTRMDQKVDGFMSWLKTMVDDGLLTTETRPGMYGGSQPWTNLYVQSSYQQGIKRARQELRKKGYDVPPTTGFTPMGRNPISVAFNQPFHAERVALIYTRAFNELQGITDAMDQQISRVLSQGLVEGRNPREIARMITDRVDKIGITRARTLARTEVIAAHHQATINEYEQWGAFGVSVVAEWLTAGYNVCPICINLSKNGPYSLEKIRGMIPAHPNCRCCAIPISKEEAEN